MLFRRLRYERELRFDFLICNSVCLYWCRGLNSKEAKPLLYCAERHLLECSKRWRQDVQSLISEVTTPGCFKTPQS